ncbi:MAG TPA: hypothetical protein PLY88_07620 [Candidatus Omnitrophota bacterium]|nr:hypothetical protein [Candidatus Omnitrophota bacterium]
MKYSDLKAELDKNNKIKRPFAPYQKKFTTGKEFKLDIKPRVRLAIGIPAVVILLLIFIGLNIKPQIDQQIQDWVKSSKGRKFELSSVEYGGFRYVSYGVVFSQVRARGLIRYDYPYFQPRHFQMDIPILQISFSFDFRRGIGIEIYIDGLEVRGGDFLPGASESPRRLESISELNFRTRIPVQLVPWQWKRSVLIWARQFKRWVFSGADMTDVFMVGNAAFAADGLTTRVYFHSVKKRNGSTHLEGDANDLRKIAHILEPKFTDEDVRIASKNLLKTPQLLYVRTLAEEKARALYQPGVAVSYDTVRHIFWSYFLTKIFSVDFALRVTDAHESYDSGNTAEESKKDLRNNAFGIEYAQSKLSEQEVAQMILNDPRVLENQGV